MESVTASAPSNIALIKYMGKEPGQGNRPTNSSLSWTLDHLRTFVRLTSIPSGVDEWRPLEGDGLLSIELSQKGRDRFLQHFLFLKEKMGLSGSYLLESASNFPSDCGLASSASSFAALTKATFEMAQQHENQLGAGHLLDWGVQELAELSRQGSGSSIRSFFGPWVLWHSEGVRPLEFPMGPLSHQVVVVERHKKAVSSSDAHKRVLSSGLFAGRVARAESRLAQLLQSMREVQWSEMYEICWNELWDMHSLFETSSPPFGYMEPGSVAVLNRVRSFWQENGDGPVVTMDAGANVHLLYREDQQAFTKQLRDEFLKSWVVLSSPGPARES